MLARLHEKDLRVCVWINPYIAQRSPLFAEAAASGYLVKRADGSVWQWDLWQAGMGLVDFTNPDATAWYQGKLRALIDQGVDCFKTDFGERIPLEVDWFDGSDPDRMHNLYTQLYNKAVHDVLVEAQGEGEAVLFARSATAGGQIDARALGRRFDLDVRVDGRDAARRALARAQRLRALEPRHRRVRGHAGCRGLQALDGVRAARLAQPLPRLQLLPRAVGVRRGGRRGHPHLHASEDAAHAVPVRGGRGCRGQPASPILRPMPLEFPDDPAVAYLDRQYMLGADILVAPVFTASGDVEFYLPPGTWTHLLTGEEVAGGGWRRETHGFDSRCRSMCARARCIPWGARTDRPDYDYLDGLRCGCFAGGSGTPRSRSPRPTAGVGRFRRLGGESRPSGEGWRPIARSSGIVPGRVGAGVRIGRRSVW